MNRAVLAWALCAAALIAGVATAALAAQNRARGDELDRLERWCEAQSRRNDLARVANQREEWRLLGQGCEHGVREPGTPPRETPPHETPPHRRSTAP